MIQLQHGDDTLKEIIKWLKHDKRPEYKEVISCSPELRHNWHVWSSLFLKESILYKSFHIKDGMSEHVQFMVPHSMRSEVLRMTHNSLPTGRTSGTEKDKKKDTAKILLV